MGENFSSKRHTFDLINVKKIGGPIKTTSERSNVCVNVPPILGLCQKSELDKRCPRAKNLISCNANFPKV